MLSTRRSGAVQVWTINHCLRQTCMLLCWMKAHAQEGIARKQRNRWWFACLRSTSSHDPNTLQPDSCCIYTMGIHEAMIRKRCWPRESVVVSVALYSTIFNHLRPRPPFHFSLVTTQPADINNSRTNARRRRHDRWRGACRSFFQTLTVAEMVLARTRVKS